MEGGRINTTFSKMAAVLLLLIMAGGPSQAQDQRNDLPFFPQPPAPGPCPTVPVVKNFNLHRYLGRWYEIERFFAPFQGGDCVTADYSLFNNGSVSVINSQVLDGELDSAFGVATLGSDTGEGKLIVQFPFSSGQGSPNDPNEPNYTVVATDYDNYAVVYSCSYFGPQFKIEFSWILARQPKIPESFLRDLKNWLEMVNIDSSRYNPTNQDETCIRRPLN